jgi:hypothetical protein
MVTIETFDGLFKHVEGQAVTITKDNCLPLSQLSEEFGFPSLKSECEDFMKQNQEIPTSDSSVTRICLIEEELHRQESEQLLVSSELKNIDGRLLSLEKHLSNLQGLFIAEQQYRRGQELIYGEHGFERSCLLGLSLLKQSADENHPDSCYAYGKHLSEGLICDRDYTESAKYLEQSSQQGNSFGSVGFGLSLLEGKGVEQNVVKAVEFLQRSANESNSLGQFHLGRLLYSGEGIAKNQEEAVRYLRLSASQGSPQGQTLLGIALQDGGGIERDLAEAVKSFKLSADQGNSASQTYTVLLFVMAKELQMILKKPNAFCSCQLIKAIQTG